MDALLDRLRAEPTPYLARAEAAQLLPWLTAAIAEGDPWALWLRGRIAAARLLPQETENAETLWQRGDAAREVRCAYELGRLAERALHLDEARARYEEAARGGFAPAAVRRGALSLRQSSAEAWKRTAADAEALRAEARAWFERAIAQGYAVAWEAVGLAHRSSLTATEEDYAESQRCYARADAAPEGERRAHLLEALQERESLAPSARELALLRPWLEGARAEGDGWALWVFGALTDKGELPGGRAEAEVLWREGAAAGEPRCKFELAFGQEKRSKKAAKALYLEAEAQGSGLAALRLGHLATKWPEAARWYHRAAELGRADAWIDLARGFTSGARGAPVDAAEALRCWERAAEGGASGPVAVVAEAHGTGRFGETPIARDLDKARRFAELGLDLGEGGGSAVCQLVYARLLAAGDAGLPVDPEGAALWSRIAARPGERVQEEARGLHEGLWAALDAQARGRVDARDRELRPHLAS